MESFYKTKDDIWVDIQYIQNPDAKCVIIVWPCGFGDIHSGLYEIPFDSLSSIGYSLILYNPRGHGKSQGVFSLQHMVEDLKGFIQEKSIKLPLLGIGHSVGGAGLLKTNHDISFKKLYLCSPILSSRESVEYMYKNSHQSLFAGLFCRDKAKYSHLWDILMDSKWLEPEHWSKIKNSLEYSLEYETVFTHSIRSSMEQVAHPGHNVYSDLQNFRKTVEVFIPEKDVWFPISNLVDASQKNHIPITTIRGAKNHFFKRRWRQIWQIIIDKTLSSNIN